jgi:cytochrome c oxidase subunit 3
MALSISYLQKGNQRLSQLFLAATLFLGLFFLGVKYFEWSGKIHHGIYPNSPDLLTRGRGEVLFFGLYYSMTGLHGLHVLVGLVILSVMFLLVKKEKVGKDHFVPLENSGLYWHLVDIVWIFLFPLFYLIT